MSRYPLLRKESPLNGKSLYYIASALLVLCASSAASAQQGLTVRHENTELSDIPGDMIDSVQAMVKIHYAHTSHGEQLIYGLTEIRNGDPFYDFAYQLNSLPADTGKLCIFDGQASGIYITPDLYWETGAGMDMTRAVLDANPQITLSMWAWCTQLDTYTEGQVTAYLDSINALEDEYPNVTFVYMTGNAQATGAEGYNRFLRNQQIRAYCAGNGKVLYDFADLDAWWYDPASGEWEWSSYQFEGADVPVEHPQFHGDEASHTTLESCAQKGRALWYMTAMLAGWSGTETRQKSLGGLKGRYSFDR